MTLRFKDNISWLSKERGVMPCQWVTPYQTRKAIFFERLQCNLTHASFWYVCTCTDYSCNNNSKKHKKIDRITFGRVRSILD